MTRRYSTDAELKHCLDMYCNVNTGLENYEDIWQDLYEADRCPTLTSALASFLYHPGPIIELHRINPWLPNSTEATIISAYLPNFLEAVLSTSKMSDIETKDLKEHIFKVCDVVLEKAMKEDSKKLEH